MSRQIVFDDTGTATLVQAPETPPLAPDEVRVAVTLAGVNFWEVLQRRGKVPLGEDRVPGSEGAGVVEEVGTAVTRLVPGQRVAWSRVKGSWATHVVAPESSFVPVPPTVADETAAALLFQGMTAAYLCQETWPVQPGNAVVVTAAAGGVGQLLTQLLKSSGAQVIGVVSAESKDDAAREAGANAVLHYGPELADQVKALAPQGVAAVYDAVGAGVAEPLLAALQPRGAMVLYGSASGADAAILASDLGAGSFYLTRTAGRDYLGDAEDIRARAVRLLELAAEGSLRPAVGSTYPLADAARALHDLESRQTVGKLLLRPDSKVDQ